MKTKKEFLADVKAYQAKVRQYILFFVAIAVLTTITGLVVFLFEGRQVFFVALLLVGYFVIMVGQQPFRTSYFKRLSSRYGLTCGACSHALRSRELKLMETNPDCPSCGRPFYN